MNTEYYHADGSPALVGHIVTPTRTGLSKSRTIERFSGTNFYNSSTGHHLCSDYGITCKEVPKYHIMNRVTRMPVAKDDTLVNNQVVYCTPDNQYLNHPAIKVKTRDSYNALCHHDSLLAAGLEAHARIPYSTELPAMLEYRLHDSKHQLLFENEWLDEDQVGLWNSERYDKRKFEVWGRALVESSTMIEDMISGRRMPVANTVEVCNITRPYSVTGRTKAVNAHKIGSRYYLKSALFKIVNYTGTVEKYRRTEPSSRCYQKLANGTYAKHSNCRFLSHENRFELNRHTQSWHGEYYSIDWLDNNTFFCEDCSERFSNDECEDDCRCSDCQEAYDRRYNRDSRVKDYSCRSSNNMKSEKEVPIRFGIELEVEPLRSRDVSLDVFDSLLPSKYVTYKEDGSLSNSGFEIVTRPDCPSLHKRVWGEVLSDKRVRTTTSSWKSGSCGIHIHVSRKPLSELHIGRMLVFMNSKSLEKIVKTVAGRYNASYARINEKKLTSGKKGRYGDRYDTLNHGGEHTLEFRCFRGTLARESFLKNIEFVECVLDFCKPATCSNKEVAKPDSFLSFVRSHRKLYPNLFNFLLAKEFYPEYKAKADKKEEHVKKSGAEKAA